MKLQDILKNFVDGPLSEDCVPCSKKKQDLNEIDFQDKFSDVKHSCIRPDTLVALLNKSIERKKKVSPKIVDDLQNKRDEKDSGKKKDLRGGKSAQYPHIHRSAIPKDEEGNIDIPKFIEQITAEPKKLVQSNEKMVKSSKSDGGSIFYKIGVPSMKGLAYDLENKKFININTCPSAGDCVYYCYTFIGGYIQWSGAFLAQTRILNKMLNDPKGFEERIYNDLAKVCKRQNANNVKVLFRWNDAGDFFGQEYFNIMKRVSQKLLDAGYDFKSYVYTKNSALLLANSDNMPSNVKTTFSQGANDKSIALAKNWHGARSITIPKEMFEDDVVKVKVKTNKIVKGKEQFQTITKYKSSSSIAKIKQNISKEYGIDINTILTFDEIMKKREGKEQVWSVIILPGQADNPASRDDVKNVLLAYH